jgi:hypothetical protein
LDDKAVWRSCDSKCAGLVARGATERIANPEDDRPSPKKPPRFTIARPGGIALSLEWHACHG